MNGGGHAAAIPRDRSRDVGRSRVGSFGFMANTSSGNDAAFLPLQGGLMLREAVSLFGGTFGRLLVQCSTNAQGIRSQLRMTLSIEDMPTEVGCATRETKYAGLCVLSLEDG